MTGMSYRRTLFGDVQQAALRVLLGHNKARSGTFRVAEQGSALPFSAIPEKCPVVWAISLLSAKNKAGAGHLPRSRHLFRKPCFQVSGALRACWGFSAGVKNEGFF